MDRYIILFVSLITFLVNIHGSLTTKNCYSSSADEPHVGLLVSPIISRKIVHEIEIYWSHLDHYAGDLIGIFTETPAENVEPIYTVVPNTANGIRKTGLRADFVPSWNLTFVPQCLKYHVAWIRDGSIKLTNCLRTQPNWMREKKDILGPLVMSKVFLPGTHNSASYVEYERPTIENFIEKYAVTQDIDVLSQLIHGVRYLDIRIGHYPRSETIWWTNHGIYRSVPLETVIKAVKTFLDNTEEIVIFDVQEFPVGFNKNQTIHDRLVEYLEREFANYLLPKSYGWTSTLNSIWSSGKRLIIGYDNTKVVARHEGIWPCVIHQWGNVRSIKDLFDYLDRIETAYRGVNRLTPRSAMAELTPNTLDVILNRLGGLRQMADSINVNVTNWYSTIWQYNANIVSVDFVRASGIIQTAIESNEKRHNCRV